MRTSVLKRERCISEKTEETRPCKLKRCPGTDFGIYKLMLKWYTTIASL